MKETNNKVSYVLHKQYLYANVIPNSEYEEFRDNNIPASELLTESCMTSCFVLGDLLRQLRHHRTGYIRLV